MRRGRLVRGKHHLGLGIAAAVVAGDGVVVAIGQLLNAVRLGLGFLIVNAAVTLDGAFRRRLEPDAAVLPRRRLRVVLDGVVHNRVAVAIAHLDTVAAIAGDEVVGDGVGFVAKIAEAADAVGFVAEQLIIADGHPLHAGAKIEAVIAVVAGDVVGEDAVVQSTAGVQPFAGAFSDHAAGDNVVAGARAVDRTALDADAVAEPASHRTVFHTRIRDVVEMNRRDVERQDRYPFCARRVERTEHAEVTNRLVADRQVLDDDSRRAFGSDCGKDMDHESHLGRVVRPRQGPIQLQLIPLHTRDDRLRDVPPHRVPVADRHLITGSEPFRTDHLHFATCLLDDANQFRFGVFLFSQNRAGAGALKRHIAAQVD